MTLSCTRITRPMQEYFPADFDRVKRYVAQGGWFSAGSSMEEGDVNAPNAEAVIRQTLCGNEWFRKNFGRGAKSTCCRIASASPPRCRAFLPARVSRGSQPRSSRGGSSADVGGPESLENTCEGTPVNVGVCVGPDVSSVLSAVNPGCYGSRITSELSAPFPPMPPDPAPADIQQRFSSFAPSVERPGQGRRTSKLFKPDPLVRQVPPQKL